MKLRKQYIVGSLFWRSSTHTENFKSLPDDCQKTGNLMKSLTVVVGMSVVMTANVDVEDGLKKWR